MSAAAVQLTDVYKRYRRAAALSGVAVTIAEGESVAFVGHNGAGKTTLMKLVLGLSAPTSGDVRVWGCDPRASDFSVRRQALGYLPENVIFAPGATGHETLSFHARLKDVGRAEVDNALARMGLEQAARIAVGNYSKGMRQRLGLAQALLGHPRLLVFDEPTSGLDPALRLQFYELCATLRRDGATVLMSSHSLDEVERHLDRVAIMTGGRLIAIDTLKGLRARAGLPVTLRVHVPAGTAAAVANRFEAQATLKYVNDSRVDLHCPVSDKVRLLRELVSSSTDVHDVEVVVPGLEALYRHFTAAERTPC